MCFCPQHIHGHIDLSISDDTGLGTILDDEPQPTVAISDGDPSIFFHSYLSTGFAIVAVGLLAAGLWPRKRVATT